MQWHKDHAIKFATCETTAPAMGRLAICVRYDLFSLSSTLACAVCRSHNKHYECVYKALKNECNEATARVVVEFNVDKQQPELRASINCQLGTRSIIRPLFIVFLYFLIFKRLTLR